MEAAFADNQAAMKLATDQQSRDQTKHLDFRYHFVRKAVAANLITISYCHTGEMTADVMKAAPGETLVAIAVGEVITIYLNGLGSFHLFVRPTHYKSTLFLVSQETDLVVDALSMNLQPPWPLQLGAECGVNKGLF